jgi:hypothetical protein
LPEEEQKALRKGKDYSNKIFKKGRSEKLPFKVAIPIEKEKVMLKNKA